MKPSKTCILATSSDTDTRPRTPQRMPVTSSLEQGLFRYTNNYIFIHQSFAVLHFHILHALNFQHLLDWLGSLLLISSRFSSCNTHKMSPNHTHCMHNLHLSEVARSRRRTCRPSSTGRSASSQSWKEKKRKEKRNAHEDWSLGFQKCISKRLGQLLHSDDIAGRNSNRKPLWRLSLYRWKGGRFLCSNPWAENVV